MSPTCHAVQGILMARLKLRAHVCAPGAEAGAWLVF